jgi:transcriptional regulator with XRE-family HTH domain
MKYYQNKGMSWMKTIGRIEALMKERGWTKYKLAKETGLPQSTITSLLSGRVKNPSAETASKLAEAFNVTTDYLLGYTDINLYDWITSPAEEAEKQLKETPTSYENEKGFLSEIELSDSELKSRYKITVDGRELSDKEWKKLLAFVRMERELD